MITIFESQTYEVILNRMLSKIPDTFDKREGSVIYDALAPAAAELQMMYIEMDSWLNESFADTATREYLVRRASEIGLFPNPATHAVMTGYFEPRTLELTPANRFNLGIYNYQILESLGDGRYLLTCETAGAAPNTVLGDLTPIEEIPGLTEARLIDCAIFGEDEEDTEALRERYFRWVSSDPRDGNVADYESWCDTHAGIGRYKVIPLWNGANTVKVSILDSNNEPASTALINEFQEYLDPKSEGLGNGVAPIGSIVTVSTATTVTINVSATITLAEGYVEASGIDEAVTEFLRGISYKDNKIYYFELGCAILNCPCVGSISSLEVNGAMGDLILGAEQIPKFGTGTWTVSENG